MEIVASIFTNLKITIYDLIILGVDTPNSVVNVLENLFDVLFEKIIKKPNDFGNNNNERISNDTVNRKRNLLDSSLKNIYD